MSKSTCTVMRGAGRRSQCMVTCGKHGVGAAGKRTFAPLTHKSNASHHMDNPPPQHSSHQALPFIRYINGRCFRRTTRMNMQNSAAEEKLRCVLAGTLMKVAPLLSQGGGVCLLSANLFGCGGKQRKCVR